ncbi:MAG: (2Fe-2S)-binding protein [Bdellovibrionales bacterium]|nr:(2Fe-2S)-binding protein [Bdellovibrionales bacterium]
MSQNRNSPKSKNQKIQKSSLSNSKGHESNKVRKNSPIVCRCNNVSQERIEKAIVRGCRDLNRIFDATSAGVGACGGSCRIYLARMLESYLRKGEFPTEVRPQANKK